MEAGLGFGSGIATTVTTTTTSPTTSSEEREVQKDVKKSPTGTRTRKSNGKSRSGCLVCKKRRVKCDEERPSCSRCKNQLQTCVYQKSDAPRWKNNVMSFSLASKAPKPKEASPVKTKTYEKISFQPGTGYQRSSPMEAGWDGQPVSPIRLSPQNRVSFMPEEDCGKYDTQDVLLLVNFESNTMKDLVGDPALWGEVLQLGFQHTFLFHAILALSARQLRKSPTAATLSSHYDYKQLEDHHLQTALSTYHPTDVDVQNPEAIVSTSFILYFHMCSVLDFDPFAPIPKEDTSFLYLRGICSVITSGPDVKQKITLFRDLIEKPYHFPYFLQESFPVAGPAKVLVDVLDSLPDDSAFLPAKDSREIYRSRITSLAPYLVACSKPDLVQGAIQELLVGFKRWQAHCPLSFDVLVQNFEPIALLVLAHFYAAIGTAMIRMDRIWWWWQEKHGFMVDNIARFLGPEWDACMAWPKKMAVAFRCNANRQPLPLPCRPLDNHLSMGDLGQVNFGRGLEAWV
ncbi:hypothetical protein BJ875DRAFT_436529 [Amylocarpus encephaloides]|uniref:Zn(2)-C6 fungal-type domain-containing protein n=1 Tax=Amylocarpus encephaloides TaxID=45428 RepID=A0A9P7YTG6_9HELO|nr:hypothetical protein BJ875DRAFT_436529 [Amylocarpus encephaloides]